MYRRKEDEADKWLREHDPYYSDRGKNKRKKVSHPYETPEQEHRRYSIEIPMSTLSTAQLYQLKQAGAGAYDEDGNFNL